MKIVKCVVCLEARGKRVCELNNGALICPRCCAQIRNPDCAGCPYYAQAEKYAIKKAERLKTDQLIMRVYPEVDEAVDQALAMVERGEMLAGQAIITNLLKKHPDIHTVQFAMGVVHAMQGQYDESIVYFDNAIKIFPYFVEAWFNKGTSYQKKLDPGKAIRAFQKVVELGDSADSFVRQAKDFVNDMENQVRKEIGISLDVYLKSNDKFDEAFAAMQNGEWEKAIAGFEEVLEMNPKAPQTYGNMGTCYGQLGRKQEALAAFDKALELDPRYEPAMLNRAIVDSLEEGEKPESAKMASVAYYKEYPMQKKSLFDRFFGRFKA